MVSILDKKDFYKMMIRDRLPLATADFYTEGGGGKLDFFSTPLGTAICATVDGDKAPSEIKMYDRSGGRFELQNVFCGENLIRIEDGAYVGVSGKLQMGDVVDRKFLIKIGDLSIITRAKMILKPNIDKRTKAVYN